MSAGDTVSTTFAVAVPIAVVLGLASLIGFPIYKSIAADGRVEYCYVETEQHHVPNQANVVLYQVWGFRAWRGDRRIATNLPSLEAARAEAERYGCSLK